MKSADIVIVGGGVVGSSIAWHLAARNAGSIIVIDRTPAGGSTSKATGGFRSQFSTPVNIRMSLLAREKLLRFKEDTGVDPGYSPCGYLFLAATSDEFASLCDANAVQHDHGADDTRIVGESEIRELQPAAARGTYIGGAWGPTDGFIRPLEILRGYREDAMRRGVTFLDGVNVLATKREGDRITALETTEGTVTGSTFVNAAGAWAGVTAREQFGSDLPVTPLRRCVVPTMRTHTLSETMPMTIWVGDGFHLRVRDRRVLLLWPDPVDSGFEGEVHDDWIDRVEQFTKARVPALRDVPLDRSAAWSGLYEMSPDRHAIVGRAAEFDNLFVASGNSGHGVMHSPALGQLVSEQIVDGVASTIDISALRPTRFAEGAAIHGSHLL